MLKSQKHWGVRIGGAGRLPHWQNLIRPSAAINDHSGAANLEILIPPEESQPLAEEVIETVHQTQTLKLINNV